MRELKDILRSPRTLQVINYFYLHPNTYVNEVRKELGMIGATAISIIKILKELKILVPLLAKEKKIRYKFTEKGLEIAKRLNEFLGALNNSKIMKKEVIEHGRTK